MKKQSVILAIVGLGIGLGQVMAADKDSSTKPNDIPGRTSRELPPSSAASVPRGFDNTRANERSANQREQDLRQTWDTRKSRPTNNLETLRTRTNTLPSTGTATNLPAKRYFGTNAPNVPSDPKFTNAVPEPLKAQPGSIFKTNVPSTTARERPQPKPASK